MSKDRARRRAHREQLVAQRAAALAEAQRRTARRRVRRDRLASRLPRPIRTGTSQGSLAHRRRAQNGLLALTWLALQVLVFFASDDWWLRGFVAIVSILAVPIAAVLLFDRRL